MQEPPASSTEWKELKEEFEKLAAKGDAAAMYLYWTNSPGDVRLMRRGWILYGASQEITGEIESLAAIAGRKLGKLPGRNPRDAWLDNICLAIRKWSVWPHKNPDNPAMSSVLKWSRWPHKDPDNPAATLGDATWNRMSRCLQGRPDNPAITSEGDEPGKAKPGLRRDYYKRIDRVAAASVILCAKLRGQAQEAGKNKLGSDAPKGFEGLGSKVRDFSQFPGWDSLTEKQRNCMSLNLEYEIKSPTEIGRRLGLSRQVVSKRLTAARKKMDNSTSNSRKKCGVNRGLRSPE